MRDTLRKVGESGLCTMEYESGYTRRLDSAVRMNLLEGIRQINQGIQDKIGEELGADGVEISAHIYCAPDHEDVQGRQMTNAEYAKWDAEHAYPKRQIGKLNCHHFVFRVLLGIQEPIHTPEELDRMKEENAKGIYFEGKHYTGYQATQIQRSLEAQIRKYKDIHTLARSAEDDVLKRKAQTQITALTHKYKEFSEAAGLSFKGRRLRVSGYKPSGAGLTSADKGNIIFNDKQFGKKIGKHAQDWNLDSSSEQGREEFKQIILNITNHPSEPVRIGEWRGQNNPVLFHISGDDVVITKQNGEFVTILKGGVSNARVKNARKR